MAVREKTTKNQTFTSGLVCQGCENPLQFKFSSNENHSLPVFFNEIGYPDNLNEGQDDPNAPLPNFYGQFEGRSRKVMVPANISDTTSDFMFIEELVSLPLDNIQSLKITDTLMDLTSDQSTIDRHLCKECTDKIHDQMDSQLNTANNELYMHQQFLENFKDDDEYDIEELQAQLRESQKEEAILEAELSKLEDKQKSTEEIRKCYEDQTVNTLEEERKKRYKCCQVKYKILLAEDGGRSINNQLMYAQAKLKNLAIACIFKTTFYIWHEGPFGTINNFRLGIIKRQKILDEITVEIVDWLEINTAWGLTVLLLHSLAMKINLTFERYRLVPYGNYSYIVPLDNKTKYLPLYGTGGSTFVLDSTFNDAMMAFLDCLQQLIEKVENCDSALRMPYKMDKGKLENSDTGKSYSIRIEDNCDEGWTKALKFMLTNVGWAMNWVSDNAS